MDALIPPPRDDDDEDVYLALQTAKALWARNERDDALRWLRRAAEQASDANADDRALELFKAAADVASRMQSAAPAAPSVPPAAPAPPARTGPPPPPNRPPVELAPGPRGGGWSAPGAAPSATPQPAPVAPGTPAASGPPGRPPPPNRAAQSAPPPAVQPQSPPPAPSAPVAAYPPPPRAAGGSRPGATPSVPPPQARPAPMPSAPPAAMPPQAVPLLRPKVGPGAAVPGAPALRPQPTPAPPQVRAAPIPAPRAAEGRSSRTAEAQPQGSFHRPGNMLGGGTPEPVFEEPDSYDDPSEVPTRVGKLSPELVQQAAASRQQAAAAPQVAPQAQPQAPPPAVAVRAAPAPQAATPPRKTARRRTLNRGEQSPLAAGRKPAGADGQRAQPAGAVPAPRARVGQPLPSEVPTEPGNDARAGAARAAEPRALAVADEDVTAQREVSVAQHRRDRPFDDLDEDTSVLPDLKIAAARRAEEGARRPAEPPPPAEPPQEVTAIGRNYGIAAPPDEDRPTPSDDLSSTSPPDTSRTSTDAIETAAMDFGGQTVKYSPGETPWVTTAARGPAREVPQSLPRTAENPAAAAQAAAAEATMASHSRRGAATAPAAGVRAAAAVAPFAPAAAPAPAAAAPVCAFRVALLGPNGSDGGVRVMALAPGAAAPAGATTAMLVATTEAESAELARLFGYKG